jgi:alkanesulfonate monooxygenase SsuD/methylene tetrahydromethanopterin reductase-like flavin-dependent oxidoreductase (luciferase family)
VKLGLLIEAEAGLDWARWRLVLLAAERLGFDSVWVSDHLQSAWSAEPGAGERSAPGGLDPWVALAIAATQTRRLRLGSLVSPITLRPPVLLARTARAVAELAPGRLTVGLGLGWNAAEHRAFGLPFPPLAERARVLDQGIGLLREHVAAPLLIGGSGETTLDLVARHADAWNMTTADAGSFAERSAALDQRCAAIGRAGRAISRSVACGVLVGRDPAELLARGRRMQSLVPPLGKVDAEQVPAAARSMGWLAGTPGELVSALEPLAAAGAELAILGHYDPDDVAALELIAARVMPAVA